MEKEHFLLYAITDTGRLGHELLSEQVEGALKGGITLLQYREKHWKGEELEKEAREIQALCRQYNVPFLVNDNVELAKKIGADGVHLGQGDMKVSEARKILGNHVCIGVTAKTIAQAKEAEREGADYLGSGAVFATSTKADAKPLSHEGLREICRSVSIPVVAIGGISVENIHLLEHTEIAGVAVAGDIFGVKNTLEKTKQLRREAEQWLQH